MIILVYTLLIGAAAALVWSIVVTANLFKCFTADETDSEQKKDDLIKYRRRMIISYAVAVLLITAAAVIKIIFVK